MERRSREAEKRGLSRSSAAASGSAAQRSAMFWDSLDAIISTNLSGVITSWSPGAQRLFGYEPDEMIGDTLARLVPVEHRTEEADILYRVAGGASVTQLETDRLRKDCSLIAVSRAVLPILDGGGNVIGAYDVSRDRSRFRKLEQALADSEARFHQIFDNMLEGCQVLDRAGRFVYVNESLTHQCRVPRETMIGRTMGELFPAFAQSETFAAFERCMLEGRPTRCETRYEYADGSYGWFDLSIQPALEGIFCLSVDITERKNAEEALAASERYFHQITDSLPLLVWTATAEGACDYLSRQWELYTGDSAQQSLGRGWLACVHPEDRAAISRAWQDAVEQGVEFRAECRLRRYDQTYRWFDCRATPLRDGSGVVTKWFGSSTDVDDVRHAQLVELHKHKLESLGTLASGIAHDFNGMLFAILGNTELAVRALEPGHRALTLLSEVRRASLRARDLVRRILAFSRREEPKREAAVLAPVVEEAVAFLRPTLSAKIELSLQIREPIPAVLADTAQTHQLIMNLVANAAHAIGSRVGKIMLELGVVRAERTLATTTRRLGKGTYVRLSVRDDGCGMDAHTVEHIFDPFFTTKPVGEGTGLGLSVVASIMNSPESAIDVRSEPGRGSVFELYFPTLHGPSNRIREAASDEPSPAGGGRRVLYVDDDEMLVRMETKLLENLGYVADGCSNPVEALTRVRSRPEEFDAVITDLSMPHMSGLELARELLLLRPSLPVILVSGRMEQKDIAEARLLGVGAFLVKPFTVAAMGRALGDVLAPGPTA